MATVSYLTLAELYSRLGGETAVKSFISNESEIERLIADASRTVMSYIESRYETPDTAAGASEWLKATTATLVRVSLRTQHVGRTGNDSDAREKRLVIQVLEQLRSGDKKAPSNIGLPEKVTSSKTVVSAQAPNQVDTPVLYGRLNGLRPDEDIYGSPYGNGGNGWSNW